MAMELAAAHRAGCVRSNRQSRGDYEFPVTRQPHTASSAGPAGSRPGLLWRRNIFLAVFLNLERTNGGAGGSTGFELAMGGARLDSDGGPMGTASTLRKAACPIVRLSHCRPNR